MRKSQEILDLQTQIWAHYAPSSNKVYITALNSSLSVYENQLLVFLFFLNQV